MAFNERDSHGYQTLHKIARLKQDTQFVKYTSWSPTHGWESLHYTVPKGTQVKVVMESRFGDVGITTDLNAERGYEARVDAIDYLDFDNV